MKNERLRRALDAAGLTHDAVGETLGVDPKTVQRWVTTGRAPHPRTRKAVADLLALAEADLWPATRPTGDPAGVTAVLPSRATIPVNQWLRMLDNAAAHVDVLAWAATFFHQLPHIAVRLAEAADRGAAVRLCFADPASGAVARHEVEEGPFLGPGVLAGKVRTSLAYYRHLLDTPGVAVRLHHEVVYASLFKLDDDLVVNPHVFGRPASENPALLARRGGTVYDAYAASFDHVWDAAAPWKGDAP